LCDHQLKIFSAFARMGLASVPALPCQSAKRIVFVFLQKAYNMPSFVTHVLIAIAVTSAGLASAPAHANSQKTWGTISDIGAYGLSGTAIGLPLVQGDMQGALQAGGSIAAAQLVTFGLKRTFPEIRPDGSDNRSFPSGHTAQSFAAAASIYNRRGPAVGIPAFAIASLVGVARVKADKHHWYDVVVGAGIGSAAGFLITGDKPDRNVAIIPWGDTKGGGVSVAMRF
jgi:membrane-associated phospholipid phosphatase